jgi:hypothetical protein
MAFGIPHPRRIGPPVPLPGAGRDGLAVRIAGAQDAPAILAHYRGLEPGDLNRRFCGAVSDEVLERHVAGAASRRGFVLTAHDRPLRGHVGPVRAVAEVAIAGDAAELGISVDAGLRRRGVGSDLVLAAARLLALRGVRRLQACTLAGNRSFMALARKFDARIELGSGEVEVLFDVPALHRAWLCRVPERGCPAA